MDNYCRTLDFALEEENKGNFREALNLYKQALRESADPGPVLFEIGRFLFEREIYEEALDTLVRCYQLGYRSEEVKEIIMKAFYEPNIIEFKANYEKNVDLLSKYHLISPKNYPDFSELQYCFVPYSDSKFVIFDKLAKKFGPILVLNEPDINHVNMKNKQVVLIQNEFNLKNILVYEKKTADPNPILWSKAPFYLYYQEFSEFVQYLQVNDFTELLKLERTVFLFGQAELSEWFSDPQSVSPSIMLNAQGNHSDVAVHITEISRKKLADFLALEKDVNSYYDNLNKQELLQNIKSKKPRILFATSRFTKVLQYCIRDCILVCEKLGIPNQLIIEKSDIHRISKYEWILLINDFKPDIIFVIDHFRWEFPWFTEKVAYATWIQDPLPHIMSKENAAKIKEMDFILNLFFTGNEFFSLGYPEKQLIDAPFAVNPNIYKTVTLTEKEKKQYQSDLCIFSYAGNPEKGLERFFARLGDSRYHETLTRVFKAVYKETYELIYSEQPLYSITDFKDLISKWLNEFGLNMNDETIDSLASKFRIEVGFRIHRSVPLEWLHEKGYNMKLWGEEWTDHPILSRYAQGVAQNGETLSKIINASKIVIGTNPAVTTHPRVFETILSNGFYLGVNIPEEYDWANIRRLMEEDKEIVFFNSRQDLYNKIDYYLQKEDERLQIIENGKKKIIAELTYEALIKRVIKEIGDKIEQQINESGI